MRAPKVSSLTISILLCIGLQMGSLVGAAELITFCFKWDTGAPYANQPVFLMNYDTRENIRPGQTNASGCGTFYRTPTGIPLMVRAHVVLNGGWYQEIYAGDSELYAFPGPGRVDLGLGLVVFNTSF